MGILTRRQFVRRTSALFSATWGATLWTPGVRAAMARTAGTITNPAGTTLESTLAPTGSGPYFTLAQAPGWPFVVREELTTASPGREDRRTAIASIVHLTDVHLIDTQAPTRVEFLDRQADPPQQAVPFESAYRGQETLTTQVGDAMIRQLNAIGAGPVTGRAYDCAVSTGDNIDNQQENELGWFLTLLDGGDLTPNSGDLSTYEGVQDDEAAWYDLHYWHPNPTTALQGTDNYRTYYGWGDYEGLLDAAITPFTATGLRTRWYSCYGNHDGLLSGNVPMNAALDAYNTGGFKVVSQPAGMTSGDLQNGLINQDPTVIGGLLAAPARPITADPGRRFISATEWVQLHLDSPATPGPVGHGYDQRNLDTGELFFTFQVAPGVLGIVLDTVNRGGYAEGSIGAAQLAWLEARIVEVSRRYHDASGVEVTHEVADQLVVLFSHHNSPTMENPAPDPAMPLDERIQGAAFVDFVHRFPNVIAWVNGHSHVNRVWPRPSPLPGGPGFWEINTAAHVDFPEHARIIEIVDNADGTLSIFGTLIDHAGPARPEDGDRDPLSLAGISRELSANDPQVNVAGALGALTDRNVELLIARPFTSSTVVDAPPPATEPTAPPLPTTGGGLGAAALGAAVAGSIALRQRRGGDVTGG